MNLQTSKILRGVILVALMLLIANVDILAQCPMCKMGAESNLKNGGSMGKGLNAGIMLLLGMPYYLVGGIAFVWWRNRKKKDEQEVDLVSTDLA
jgi:hypothetical protein